MPLLKAIKPLFTMNNIRLRQSRHFLSAIPSDGLSARFFAILRFNVKHNSKRYFLLNPKLHAIERN